jgi:hypothetical protein
MDRVLRGGPVTLVNWQAGTIFEVLERAQMQLDQAGEFDLARTIEYLDFFVSFTASETGQPLLLLRGGTLDDPEGLERRGTIPFEAVISSRRLARDPEFLCRPDDPDVTSSQEPVEQTGLKPPVPVGDDGRIPDVAMDPSGAKDPRSLRLTGTGLFEDTCFRVTFEVRSQDKFATDVKIIDNTPLKRLDEGLSQYRVDRVSKTGPRLLLLNKAREEVSRRESDFPSEGRTRRRRILSPSGEPTRLGGRRSQRRRARRQESSCSTSSSWGVCSSTTASGPPASPSSDASSRNRSRPGT